MTRPAPGTMDAPGEGARRVVVFACGDALRGDDSVAGRAVASLPSGTTSAADVRSVGALEPEMLMALDPQTPVVVVDAVVGVGVGDIVELDLAGLASKTDRVAAWSSHQLPLERVISLAELLRGAPVRGRFVGLGIGRVEGGAGLSPGAAAAMPRLVVAVERAVETLTTRGSETPRLTDGLCRAAIMGAARE
jgi:hydrogenase maturation protease